MTSEHIVKSVSENHIEPSWTVFHYNTSRSVLMLLYKIFFAGLLLGITGVLWYYSSKPLSSDVKLTVYGLGSVGLIGLLFLVHHIYTMFFLKTNMIVCTEREVIKSVRGKIQSWTYQDMANIRQIVTHTKNSYPVYSVEFTDQKTNRVLELARGREFGRSQEIFSLLQTKEIPSHGTSS